MTYKLTVKELPDIQKISAVPKTGYPLYSHTDLQKQQGGYILPLTKSSKTEVPVLAYTDKLPDNLSFVNVKKEIYQVRFRNTAPKTGFCVIHKLKNQKQIDSKQVGTVMLTTKTENDIQCPYCQTQPVLKKTELKKLKKAEPVEFTCKNCKAVISVKGE